MYPLQKTYFYKQDINYISIQKKLNTKLRKIRMMQLQNQDTVVRDRGIKDN